MEFLMVPLNRWDFDRYHIIPPIGRKNTTYIPLIVLAYWVIIYHLPPIKGTRNSYWFLMDVWWIKHFLFHDLEMLSGQTMATRLGDLGKWDPLFQGNLGWWNIIIWPENMYVDEEKALIFQYGRTSRELTRHVQTWRSRKEFIRRKNISMFSGCLVNSVKWS